MTDLILVYITTSGAEEAEKLARMILSEKLASCVNIYQGVRSFYLWEGAVETSEEATLVVKTVSFLYEELAKRVREEHSYDLPCIVAIPVLYAEKKYEEWIKRETSREGRVG